MENNIGEVYFASPDKDPGHRRANKILIMENDQLALEEISMRESFEKSEQKKWEKLYEILENTNTNKIFNGSGRRKNLKGFFGRVKRAGMNVKNYEKMNNNNIMEYFCEVRNEIKSHIS